MSAVPVGYRITEQLLDVLIIVESLEGDAAWRKRQRGRSVAEAGRQMPRGGESSAERERLTWRSPVKLLGERGGEGEQ